VRRRGSDRVSKDTAGRRLCSSRRQTANSSQVLAAMARVSLQLAVEVNE